MRKIFSILLIVFFSFSNNIFAENIKLIKRISIEDRYKELFLNHLMLKEKYSKAQEELNKIRNLDLIEV